MVGIMPVYAEKELQQSRVNGFHNAGEFCLWNLEEDKYEILTIDLINKEYGSLFAFMKKQKIEAVVCKNIPFMSLKILSENGFSVLEALGETVKDNLDLFMLQKLPVFNGQTTMTNNECSSSGCSSCSSACS